MNNKYQNIKKQTIVYDEKDNYNKREYQSNIEGILIKENEIETLEKESKKIDKQIGEAYNSINNFKKRCIGFICGGLISGGTLIGFLTILGMVGLCFESMPLKILLGVFWGSTMTTYNLLTEISKKKKQENIIAGNKNQLVFIEKELAKKMQEIKELEEEKKIVEECPEEYIIQKVNDREALERQKSLLSMCWRLGVMAQSGYISQEEVIEKYEHVIPQNEIKECIKMTLNRKKER